MPDIRGSVGMRGHLGIVVHRARPTLRTRVLDAWAAICRRFRP